MTAHDTFTAILRDGLAVQVVHNGDVLAAFHKLSGQSMDWALANEGYSIVTDRIAVNGWHAFRQNADRRGYGMSGYLSRMACEIAALVESLEREAGHGEWRDYVAGPEISTMLEGFANLLQCSDGGNSWDAIRGDLHAWAIATAERIGHPLEA